MKRYWLFKTEPSTYSIDDLEKDSSTEWSGIRNYQVRNMIRDDMNIGDEILVYHSSSKEIGIAGRARIKSKSSPDTEQFQRGSHYFDPKSTRENPTWLSRDIIFIEKFSELIPLERLRKEKELENMCLLQKGNRLSITPVSETEYKHILSLARGRDL